MERDYFKDRPESVQYNRNIYKGAYVFICLKDMQKHAKVISDLTLARVTANLTTQWQHPRGQKIRGDFVPLDKFGNRVYEEIQKDVVGRCTYILDENLWSFDTSEGKKFLKYDKNRDKLTISVYEQVKDNLKLYCLLKYGKACFKMPLCRFMYFKDITDAQEFIDNIIITACTYKNDRIYFSLNGTIVYENTFDMFLDGEKIFNPREMYYYVDSVSNGELSLELDSFTLERII